MTFRRNLNDALNPPSPGGPQRVRRVQYGSLVGPAGLVTDLENSAIIGGTLDLLRASNNQKYQKGSHFEEVPPGSYRNLSIPSGTAIIVDYLVDDIALSSGIDPTSPGGGVSGYAEPVMSGGGAASEMVLTDEGDAVMVMIDAS